MVCLTESILFQLKNMFTFLFHLRKLCYFPVFLNLTLGGSASLSIFSPTPTTPEATPNFPGPCVQLVLTPPVTALGCPITVNFMFGVPATLPPGTCVAAGKFECSEMFFA